MVIYQAGLGSSGWIVEAIRIGIPAMLIIAGWVVLYRNSRKIESRKELRSLVQHVIDISCEIQKDAEFYYGKDNKSHSGLVTSRIKSNFLLLSKYLYVLRSLGLDLSDAEILNNYRKTVTGGHFETKDYKKQVAIPGWEIELAQNHAAFKIWLDQAYFRWSGAFKKNFPEIALAG